MRQVKKTLSIVATEKLVKEIAPKYADRKGGYTRIIKGSRRTGDAAEVSIIEFV